jgi:N-glycosylase/DNA lyase
MNDFETDLAYSLNARGEAFWLSVYKIAFPNFSRMEIVRRLDWQRKGIDRIIYLSNGNKLKIDEKKRRREYSDILLEYLSNDRTRAPGWIEKDLAIDYLAYAFMESQRVYFFPFPALFKAWYDNKEHWFSVYDPVTAKNRGYNTLSLPIPIDVLQRAVSSSMIIQLENTASTEDDAEDDGEDLSPW